MDGIPFFVNNIHFTGLKLYDDDARTLLIQTIRL